MSNAGGEMIHNFSELFGSGVEKVFQTTFFDFFPDIIYVYDLQEKKLRCINKRISGILGFTYQCRFNRKSGGWSTVNVIGRVIKRDATGIPLSLLFIAQDISSQIIAAEELKAINDLKNSVSNLEEFTQIASHDIQEPLRRIATFSERMKAKFATDLNGEAMGYLDRIMKTSKNAHLLIDGLLDFLQLDHKQLHFVTTDLNALLIEVKDELELLIEESQATISSGNLPKLEIIPQQIKQLLVNLVSNALKFQKPGRPLAVFFDARKLSAADATSYQLDSLSDYYVISVKDNGVGFNTAISEKMFQMFQRFHNKSVYPGAGIGLAICRKITDKHRGLIMAHSVVGEGATFSIILPVKQMKSYEAR